MTLSNPQIRKLKALAQRLEPVVYVGKAGVTDELVASVEQALNDHELIKVKFTALKEEKKSLATEIAARTHSELVWIVGHVALLYREQPDLRSESETRNPKSETHSNDQTRRTTDA
jgi:RNA-binding protein